MTRGNMRWTMRTADLDAFWGIIEPPNGDEAPSTSKPFSLGLDFAGTATTVAVGGRTERRLLPPMGVGVNGEESIGWIALERSAECISIALSARLRRDLADEMRAPLMLDMDDLYGIDDPVVSAVALRLRAAGRGGWPLSTLELDELTRRALRRMAVTTFGGVFPRSNSRDLDTMRLRRIVAYIDAHLDAPLLLGELASVASMSPFAFQRAFRHTTGLSPYEFQTAWRMQRATELIDAGERRGAVAQAVGYTPGHGFRKVLRKYTGR